MKIINFVIICRIILVLVRLLTYHFDLSLILLKGMR
jgi:hypothetical protein